MFDLEKSIAAWRHRFEHHPSFLPDDVRELERHVRDHVAARAARGETEEAAFLDVMRAMGEHHDVAAAYRRVRWGKLKRTRCPPPFVRGSYARQPPQGRPAQPPEASGLSFNARFMADVVVRVRPDDLAGTLAFLERQWKAVAPAQPFRYAFLDDTFDVLYRAERRLGAIATLFAGLSILIACPGLFGLAAFMTQQRTKEIGVRKVFGASVAGLVVLLSKEFARLVVLAFVVAAPLAALGMGRWLEHFAYRAGPGVGPVLGAGAACLLLALLTVSYQTIRAARANPIDSLRHE